MNRLSQANDKIEKALTANSIVWTPVDNETLPYSTSLYVDIFIRGDAVKLEVSDQIFNKILLFKITFIESGEIMYFQHDPITQSHMWADDKYVEPIDNDTALSRLTKASINLN